MNNDGDTSMGCEDEPEILLIPAIQTTGGLLASMGEALAEIGDSRAWSSPQTFTGLLAKVDRNWPPPSELRANLGVILRAKGMTRWQVRRLARLVRSLPEGVTISVEQDVHVSIGWPKP